MKKFSVPPNKNEARKISSEIYCFFVRVKSTRSIIFSSLQINLGLRLSKVCLQSMLTIDTIHSVGKPEYISTNKNRHNY